MKKVKILVATLVIFIVAAVGIAVALNDSPGPSSRGKEINNIEEDEANKDNEDGAGQGKKKQKEKGETGSRDEERKNDVDNKPEQEEKRQSREKDSSENNDGENGSDISQEEKYEQVVSKYKSRFEHLRSEYKSRLNSLLQDAKEDLKEKEDGNKLAMVRLAYDYMKKGRQLEDECDDEFYELLGQMEEELREKNLPLEAVEKAEQEYKQQKEARKERLKSLGMDYIKGD